MKFAVYKYIISLFISYNSFELEVYLCDISIGTIALFWLLFAGEIFFHYFTFKIFVYLDVL